MVDRSLYNDAVRLLSELIAIPSFSREEANTASYISRFLFEKGVASSRVHHNVFALNKYFDVSKPTLLLNSHHDTVKPNSKYTRDPFKATDENGKLYGLGSNDAGGPLVSLMAVFLHYYEQQGLKYNLAYAATAEEEISGENGISSILSYLPPIDAAIIGEPTQMQLAVAERGLVVLDCIASGVAGHAAREEGENAIYNAMKDIGWFSNYQFPKISEWLGPVKMSVTSISTENKAHNIVPAECSFIVDVRVNECYSTKEILETIRQNVQSKVQARSTRLRSSFIPLDHPLVLAGVATGKKVYGSPTTSDKALVPFPALKMGPGDSARSHTADEFIYLSEIDQGIQDYVSLLNRLLF
jgi:acetylornithine deacetylase